MRRTVLSLSSAMLLLGTIPNSLNPIEATPADAVPATATMSRAELVEPTDPASVGLDPRQVFDRDLAAANLDRVTELLHKVAPDRLAGSEVLDAGGIVFVKGDLPATVDELIDTLPIPVVAVERLPFSRDELDQLSWDVNQAVLQVAGVEEAVSYTMPLDRGVVTVRVELDPSATVDDVLTELPESMRAIVDLQQVDLGGDLVRPETSFGGMRISSSGGNCTSGFTVEPPSGQRGILTAGHCNSMSQITHPGHGTHQLLFKDEHVGSYGDFEWHETDVLELAQFYASSSTIRNVNTIQAAHNISAGDPVCAYGRSSDFAPVCTEVQLSGAACSGTGRLVLSKLYDDPLIGGDSGGPWYRVSKAWGIHRGNCNAVEAFSAVAYADDAVGVSVVVTP